MQNTKQLPCSEHGLACTVELGSFHLFPNLVSISGEMSGSLTRGNTMAPQYNPMGIEVPFLVNNKEKWISGDRDGRKTEGAEIIDGSQKWNRYL